MTSHTRDRVYLLQSEPIFVLQRNGEYLAPNINKANGMSLHTPLFNSSVTFSSLPSSLSGVRCDE